MKTLRYLYVIAVMSLIALNLTAQTLLRENTKHTNLRNFSFEQLKSCFDDLKICGASDIYEIDDELIRRFPKLPTEQLVECFDDWKICGVGEGHASGWPISDELAHRGDPRDLLVRYWSEPKWTIRGGIEHVAYHFNDNPEVTAFMKKVLAAKLEDGEDLYWPANYLAKKCDLNALEELSSGRHRNQGCMQYQTTVVLYGKCKYRPAIPYLVDSAVYDFCGNITDAAESSLHALYPGSPKHFDTLEDLQRYFCGLAKQEGLSVTCSTR